MAPRATKPSSSTSSESQSRGSVTAFIFEGDCELGAVGLDLAVFAEDEVLRNDLRHAQIAQMLAGELDRVLGGLLPGFWAGADDLDHFVDTLRHERASLALKSIAPALVSRTRLAFSLSYADLKALSSPREGRVGDCQGH